MVDVKNGLDMAKIKPFRFKPKFKLGDVVMYKNIGFGASTATSNFMRISSIHDNGQKHPYYYGTQYYGGIHAAYESDLVLATPTQKKQYETDTHIGRLRDYGHRINPKKRKIEKVVGSRNQIHIIKWEEENT